MRSPFVYVCVLFLHCASLKADVTEDVNYWKRLADDDLHEALEFRPNQNVAKNVVIFVGDGMDINTISASRIYKQGEHNYFPFEKFHNVGLIKTYTADTLVPDSCSTATALFSGCKVNTKTAGVSAQVAYEDCQASLDPNHRLKSIVHWAQEARKSTGFVTTTRITHATPSPLYSHTANRNWECEAKMNSSVRAHCKDIARQLVEDEPGRSLNVVFGGGRQVLISDVKDEPGDPVDSWACYSRDGRNLIHDWEQDKQKRQLTHAFVQDRTGLHNLDVDNTDYVLGVFANSHMYLRNDNGTLNVVHPRSSSHPQPSLEEMTRAAVKVLRKNPNGFVLVVEGGLIDYAHHRGHARAALEETVELSKAVDATLALLENELEETLVIVTSDHSHSLVFAGYGKRSDGVLNVAKYSHNNKVPYTTLLYGTGGANNYQYEVVNGTYQRRDPRQDDVSSYDYSQQSGIVLDEAVHGGGDVAVYARGPMAHLFNSVHEQTYVAYVVAYAARMGPYRYVEQTTNSSAATQAFTWTLITVFVTSFTTLLL